MKKRIGLAILVLLGTLSVALISQPQLSGPNYEPMRTLGPQMMGRPGFQSSMPTATFCIVPLNQVTILGSLSVKDGYLYVASLNDTYQLLLPRGGGLTLDVQKSSTSLEVTGYVNYVAKTVFVTKLLVDGKESFERTPGHMMWSPMFPPGK